MGQAQMKSNTAEKEQKTSAEEQKMQTQASSELVPTKFEQIDFSKLHVGSELISNSIKKTTKNNEKADLPMHLNESSKSYIPNEVSNMINEYNTIIKQTLIFTKMNRNLIKWNETTLGLGGSIEYSDYGYNNYNFRCLKINFKNFKSHVGETELVIKNAKYISLFDDNYKITSHVCAFLGDCIDMLKMKYNSDEKAIELLDSFGSNIKNIIVLGPHTSDQLNIIEIKDIYFSQLKEIFNHLNFVINANLSYLF